MSEVTVTKEQMKAIELGKSHNNSLEFVISMAQNNYFTNNMKSLNGITAEQIVLAWHGYANVETEYVSFEKGMNALKEGLVATWTDGIKEIPHLTTDYFFEIFVEYDLTIGDFIHGKWIIEGDNS